MHKGTIHSLPLQRIVLSVAILFVITGGIMATPCEQVSITELVTEDCGYLSEKLLEDEANPDGIDLVIDTVSGIQTMTVRFNPSEVGNLTSWGSNSDFTWTFNGSGGTGRDPSMYFQDYETDHTGQFNVYAEYDDFNNDYTTVPCTLKYDGAKPASSALTGTVYFTEDSKEVTGSVDLESQMTPGCYMISADDSKWYYIDRFDEEDNKKLYLLSSFEETSTSGTAYKRQYSCDMDAFQGSFEKAGNDNVRVASGFRAKEPTISSGQILNYSGLYIDPIKTTSTQNYIYKPFGVFQSGENDLNAFRGHTGMGMWDGVTNAVLQIAQTYDTDDSNYGIGIIVEQEGPVRYPNYPSGLTCNLDYSATADEAVTILKVGGDDTFKFEKGNTIVRAYFAMTNPPAVLDWIKPSSGTHWYVVTVVDGLNISIAPEFQEDTMDPVTAQKMPAAYRMSGISGSNMLTGTGATSSLRGVTGHVGLTNGGNVQAGIGTRGGMSMSGGGWMGLGACLGTYTDITDGALGVWYGLGIESPVFSGSASVSKEIAGVGIGSLLGRAVNGTVESTCMVYGVKIKTIDPEGGTVPPENTFGIYQEGDEQNYLGGSLEINGDIKINGTSRVRIWRDSTTQSMVTNWAVLQFNNVSFDNLPEFNSSTHKIDIEKDGFYQINVCVNFIVTSCGESLEVKLCVDRGGNTYDLGYSQDDGYCDANNPENTGGVSVCFPNCVELKAGEHLYVKVKADLGGSVNIGEDKTYMTIHKQS